MDSTAPPTFAELGGSALARTAQSHGLSWIPPTLAERNVEPGSPFEHLAALQDTEPASAMFAAYTPPHPMALTADEVDQVLAELGDRLIDPQTPGRAHSFTPAWQQVPGHDRLMRIVSAANAMWWRLDLEVLTGELLRYRPGHRHGEHVDMHPGSMQRKLSASIQLSDSDDYLGGDLQLRCWGELHTMPRLRGTVIVFPSWASHLVTELEEGTRDTLVVWGWGRPVR